jgi:hypothetical protein
VQSFKKAEKEDEDFIVARFFEASFVEIDRLTIEGLPAGKRAGIGNAKDRASDT